MRIKLSQLRAILQEELAPAMDEKKRHKKRKKRHADRHAYLRGIGWGGYWGFGADRLGYSPDPGVSDIGGSGSGDSGGDVGGGMGEGDNLNALDALKESPVNKIEVHISEENGIIKNMEKNNIPQTWDEFRVSVSNALTAVSTDGSRYREMADSVAFLDDESGGVGGIIDAVHDAWVNIKSGRFEAGTGSTSTANEWEADVEFYVYDAIIDATTDDGLASAVVDAMNGKAYRKVQVPSRAVEVEDDTDDDLYHRF